MQKATLLLDDGTRLEGEAAGAPGTVTGSLGLYTGGDYMNALTDPSSDGHLCAFLMPTVGLWGVNTEHCETGKLWARGVIARDICHSPRNWRSAETLEYYLRRNVITGISHIDTGSLYRYAAEKNIQKCAVVSSPGFTGWEALRQKLAGFRYENSFPNAVKSSETYGPVRGAAAHVAVCDFGASHGLVRLLASMRIRATLLPPYDAATIFLRGGYEGLIVPQGPGAPRNHPGISQSLLAVIEADAPLMGFGLGALFIASAYGARLKPMQSPHRGMWFPVQNERSGLTVYTRQYHAQVLSDELPGGLAVTHRCPVDGSSEGFRIEGRPVAGYQYLPCADIRLGGTGEMIHTLFALLKGDWKNG